MRRCRLCLYGRLYEVWLGGFSLCGGRRKRGKGAVLNIYSQKIITAAGYYQKGEKS